MNPLKEKIKQINWHHSPLVAAGIISISRAVIKSTLDHRRTVDGGGGGEGGEWCDRVQGTAKGNKMNTYFRTYLVSCAQQFLNYWDKSEDN